MASLGFSNPDHSPHLATGQERLITESVQAGPEYLEPSRTSQIVAQIRAELDRPSTPLGDPKAQRELCSGMRPSRTARSWPSIAVRTRFFDEQVLMAIGAGLQQIVICGAGYDDRALRFRALGVRFFELDEPTTQGDKARRLRKMGASTDALMLIPVDFRRDDAAKLLRDSGHSAGRPTLFVCEGLLVYLDKHVVSRFLRGLRSVASPSSILAASLACHREGEDPDRVLAIANASRLTGRMEPWLTILSASECSGLFSKAGWVVDHTSEAGSGSSRLLLVTALPTSP